MADELTGKDLEKRAKELDVSLSEDGNRKGADQLRQEVAEAEQRLKDTGTTDTAENLDPPDGAPPSASAEDTFSVSELVATPAYLGREYDAGDVAGAFHNVDSDRRYSLADARAHVQKWRKTPEDTDPEVTR